MAKKHLIELQNDLFNSVVKELERIEVEVNICTKQAMVDPETIEDLTQMIRGVSSSIENLNRGLAMAIKQPGEFIQGYNSLTNLVKQYSKVIEFSACQEPENSLIPEYKKQLERSNKVLQLYKDIKEVRDWPKSKKKLKIWKRKGWYIEGPFTPFKEIWEELKQLVAYMEESL